MKALSLKIRGFFADRNSVIIFLIFLGILFVMFTNSVHESYPDEFDNILGGWRLLHGIPLYSGYFTQHNPVGYFIAAFVEIFSGRSFVRFRFFYTIFLFIYFVWTYRFISRRFNLVLSRVYLAFLIVLTFTSVYFWGQMLLADNVSAYLLVPVFVLLLYKTLQRQVLEKKDLVFISFLTFFAVFSALTYVYLSMGIYLYTLYYYIKNRKYNFRQSILEPVVIFAVPFVMLFLYFLITGSLIDYVKDALIFNGKYYVYNYPGHVAGKGFINPVRYMIVIFHTFFQNFTVLLVQVSSFNFNFPFNITLALANTILAIYLVIRKKWTLALLAVFYIVYANVRSNPLTSKETDYQSAVYIVTSLFIIVFILYEIYDYVSKRALGLNKVILSSLFILLAGYSFFTATYLLRSYGDKVYGKYMGTQPLIYDRPQVAPIINSITTAKEYVWIGPFSFEDLFYINGKVPSKYDVLLPEFATATDIKQTMLDQFEQNPPVVMYFDKQFFILGDDPEMYAQFFINFVNDNYVTLQQLRSQGENYQLNIPVTSGLDLDAKLYIRNDAKDMIIRRMLKQGIISRE